jgi:hypothetical protein
LESTEPSRNVKSTILPISAFLASVVAFVLLPVGAVAAGIASTVAGLLSVFVADYGRTIEPLRAPAQAVPFGSNGRTPAGLSVAVWSNGAIRRSFFPDRVFFWNISPTIR